MGGIITALLPVMIKIGWWFVQKSNASKEQKAEFYGWAKKMGRNGESCVALQDSYDSQHAANLKKIADMQRESGKGDPK